MQMTISKAILAKNTDMVRMALEHGVDVNNLDEYGMTPLIQAAIVNSKELVELLLEFKADVNLQDMTKNTALGWAVENNHLELVQLLLQHGANPNLYTTASEPILCKPLLRKQKALKELLINNGANEQFAWDFIHAKLLGHKFSLVSSVDIVDPEGKYTNVDLEGFILEFSLDVVTHSLIDVMHTASLSHLEWHFPMLKQVIDAFHRGMHLLKYQHYNTDEKHFDKEIEEALDHDLLILPLAYEGHAISLVKYGDCLAICNRRNVTGFADTVNIYTMHNKPAFRNSLIKQLLYQKNTTEMIEERLPTILDLKVKNRLIIKRQVAGNCSWANLEAAVPAALMLLERTPFNQDVAIVPHNDPAMEFFRAWTLWDKKRALQNVLEKFDNTDARRKASMGALLAAVLFQRLSADKPRDKDWARQILKRLHGSDYEYILQSYIQLYKNQNNSAAGKNLLKLIDMADDPFS